jgi:hypothetical protein
MSKYIEGTCPKSILGPNVQIRGWTFLTLRTLLSTCLNIVFESIFNSKTIGRIRFSISFFVFEIFISEMFKY